MDRGITQWIGSKMNILVVPTIREDCIKEFLKAWKKSPESWDEIIVVEDNPKKTFDLDVKYHLSWEDIENDLGEHAWIISRRDSAIRSYGFLKAFEMGADYIFTLDDDCYPVEGEHFVHNHICNIEETTRWAFSIPDMRTRGVPYDNLGKLTNVVMNVGLWQGVPDLDAVTCLYKDTKDFMPPSFSRVMARDQYFPLCGMNLCFKRGIIPLCYFPLMGKDQPFNRFDDIWFGIIAQKVCSHLGWNITLGRPHIHHIKASDKFKNLQREASGIGANETFWQMIDKIKLKGKTPVECMKEIALYLMTEKDYFGKLGQAIDIWADMFNQPE